MAETAQQLNPDTENAAGLQRLLRGTHYAGTLSGLSGAVLTNAFSPDGHAFAAAGVDGNTMLWDTHDPDRPRRIGLPFSAQDDRITHLAWAPTNTLLATSDNQGTVILWDVHDLSNPHPIGDIENGGQVDIGIAFTAGGQRLLSARRDTIKIWDIRNPAAPVLTGELRAGSSPWGYIATSGDGSTLAAIDDTATIRAWNLNDPDHPAPIGEPLKGENGPFRPLALSRDGHELASGGEDGTASLWNLASGEVHHFGQPSADNPVEALGFTPNGQTLIGAQGHGQITEWNSATGGMNTQFTQPIPAGGVDVAPISTHPEGSIFAIGRTTGDAFLWTVNDRTQPQLRATPTTLPGQTLSGAAFTSDGSLVTVGEDAIRTWNTRDPAHPQLKAVLPALPGHRMSGLALTTNGRIAVGTSTIAKRRSSAGSTRPERSTRIHRPHHTRLNGSEHCHRAAPRRSGTRHRRRQRNHDALGPRRS